MADEPEENKTTVPHSASQIRGMEDGAGRSRGRNRGGYSDSGSGSGLKGRQRGAHGGAGSGSSERSRNRGGHPEGLYNAKGDGNKQGAQSPSEPDTADNDAGLWNNKENASRRDRLRNYYKRYRKQAKIGAGVGGIGITGAIMFFGITQGPFQFIHFAQLLQQFHMKSNEDFSDDRTTKILIYALSGKGGERGRLSIKANKAADIWEKQIEKNMGIRPVYTSITRKNVGWEIVDKDKFLTRALDISVSDTKNTAAIEKVAGKGAEIMTVGEATSTGQGLSPGGGGPKLANDKLVLYTGHQDTKNARIFTRAISKEAHTWKVVSAIGSRLLIKRGGVTYHPLENKLPKPGEKLADWYSRLRKEAAKEDSQGVKDTTLGKNEEKNADGDPEATPQVDEATEATNETVEAAKANPGTETIKGLVKGLGKGAVAVGVLCAAKSIGNNVEDYKYTNDAQPMMRMGMRAITTGNQVMSGQGFNTKLLGAYNTSFYDPETKTSEMDAKTVQGELGQKQTGPNTPPEARLTNVGDKPVFFDVLDNVPGLGPVCGVSEAAGNLPIIKQASDTASAGVMAGLNVVANTFGTSVDEIMEGALAAISGQSVNTEARGAEFGNLANTGAFLSANDTAIASGGVPLDQADVAALKQETNSDIKHDNSTKSFAQRYLDPYDRTTLMAAAIDHAPSSKAQMASMISSPLTSLFGNVASVFSNLNPNAYAEGSVDYGVPKFGFSPADRDNPDFEDPFENAAIVEQPGVLDDLNAKYGKPCFGMTVTAGADGTSVETESMGSDDLNVFKVMKKPECSPPHRVASVPSSSLFSWLLPKATAAPGAVEGNSDPMFLRYRIYLADAVNTDSLDCLYGGDQSCTNLGFGNSSSTTTSYGDPSQLADVNLDMEHLYESSVDIACAPGTTDVGVQDGYHDGKKVKIRVCGIPDVPETGGLSEIKGANGKLLVNSRLSAFYVALIKAARDDGVTNITAQEGFRTMAGQIAVQGCGCAAPPGYSNHQMGLAIDWSDSMVAWLNKTGGHGLKAEVSDEPWHWSPTGN